MKEVRYNLYKDARGVLKINAPNVAPQVSDEVVETVYGCQVICDWSRTSCNRCWWLHFRRWEDDSAVRAAQSFPGWEAIKTTRGHYRSCGKDPHACCVSHLLTEEPLVRSGRAETYEPGKDTGRYWDAGATNVHWLIGLTIRSRRESNKRSRE